MDDQQEYVDWRMDRLQRIVDADDQQEYVEWCKRRLQRIVDASGLYHCHARMCAEMVIDVIEEMDESFFLAAASFSDDPNAYKRVSEQINKNREYLRRFRGRGWTVPPEIPPELTDGHGNVVWPEPTDVYFQNVKNRESLS